MSFKFGQRIEYIDCTLDENFSSARRWAANHSVTFEENIEERYFENDVLHRFFYIGKLINGEVKTPEVLSNKENIKFLRQQRMQNEADPLFYDYMEALARNENVEEAKEKWLQKKDEIRNDLPYEE